MNHALTSPAPNAPTLRERIAFALLMGIVTTGIISFGLVATRFGLAPPFARVWLRSWALAYAIVIPLILIVAPKVQSIVDARFAAAPAKVRKIAFALSMGSVTTGVISFSLIAVNAGLGATFVGTWLRAWAMSYVAVIPALLFLAPRIQRVIANMFRDRMVAEVSGMAEAGNPVPRPR